MLRRTLSGVVVAALSLSSALAAARTTVAIAPFSTTSSQEYQWIGPAMADALALRVHQQRELNGLTMRQVNAAMRQDNLDAASLQNLDAAVRLARQLGADVMMTGSYTAAWPDIEVVLTTIDPKTGKVRNTHSFTGALEKISDVEARAAKALASELGAAEPSVEPGAFGTDSLRAWREVALGSDILAWQSLGPRAADPNVPLTLPEAALKSALTHFELATNHDPDYGEAWAWRGIAQALLKDTTAAWRSFGKATALGTGHNPTAVLGASFARMREGRYDDAAEILKSAIARHPGFLHARGYLGELYNHQGRRREALAAFDEYAKIAPRQPWVLSQRGYTRAKLGDHAGALADTAAAVEILPDSPSMLVELASRYIDASKLSGAEDALLRAKQLFPNEARVYVRLGYVYLLQGKDDLAIPESEKGVQLAQMAERRRDRGYAHLNLARAFGHKGNLDLAFQHLAKAKEDGITSFDEVTKDAALKKLREDPRFAKGGY